MSYQDRGTGWFLAQLKPNSHRIAMRNLARQGFRTLLPLHEQTTRARNRFAVSLRPLFPGYVFVALDMAMGGWHAVNSTHGITRLVCLGKEPTPVPHGLISELMLRCDRDGKLMPPQRLAPGDQVRIIKGPFTDLVARIESIAPDRRIWAVMEIMGAQVRVAVSADQVSRG